MGRDVTLQIAVRKKSTAKNYGRTIKFKSRDGAVIFGEAPLCALTRGSRYKEQSELESWVSFFFSSLVHVFLGLGVTKRDVKHIGLPTFRGSRGKSGRNPQNDLSEKSRSFHVADYGLRDVVRVIRPPLVG